MDKLTRKALEEWADVVEHEKVIFREAFKRIEKTLELKPVTTISGPRRSGKSYALRWVVKKHGGIYVNFEDERIPRKPSIIREIHETYREGILTLDEVHLVNGWERVVSSISQTRKVIVTGSTSHLLSREYGTFLTGRHISVELFPLSFSEFKEFGGRDYEQFLILGGYPEVVLSGERTLLADYINDIIYRDVLPRHNTNPSIIKEMATHLLTSSSKLFTERRLANLFSLSPNTAGDYVEYLREVYLVEKVEAFHPKIGARKRLPFKLHAGDHGFVSFLSADKGWKGRALETSVYWEIRKKAPRGIQVYYGWGKREVDIVLAMGGKPLFIINVVYELSNENREREEAIKEKKGVKKALVSMKGESKELATYKPWQINEIMDELISSTTLLQ